MGLTGVSEVESVLLPDNIFAGLDSLGKIQKFQSRTRPTLIFTTNVFRESEQISRVYDYWRGAHQRAPIIVDPNPGIEEIERVRPVLEEERPGTLIALGGGSVIDFAKVLAGLAGLKSPTSLRTILESKIPLPSHAECPDLIAMPSTSGTGAEVTQFATVWDKVTPRKFSLESELIRPRWAILDPTLTMSMSPELTLFTGMDAISHGIESLWNKNASEESRLFSIKSLDIGVSALKKLIVDRDNAEARAAMQVASTYAGLAISTTRTAIAHSISYPLTAHYGVPHGLACSFTIPAIYDYFYSRWSRSSSVPDIISTAVDLIRECNLVNYALAYCSKDQVLAKLPEMHSPERADNFIFDLSMLDVEAILLGTLTN